MISSLAKQAFIVKFQKLDKLKIRKWCELSYFTPFLVSMQSCMLLTMALNSQELHQGLNA